MTDREKLRPSQMKRLAIEQFKTAGKIPLRIILDNIRSANNVGSVFRTSDAYLIDKIYLCGITGCPPSADIRKTALGAEDAVDWEYSPSCMDVIVQLKAEGFKIIALEQTLSSIPLASFAPDKNSKYAIILGNEVKGVGQEAVNAADAAIELPQYGTKHSLNVSVAAGIVIWEMFNKLRN
jgi:23S rRNA (guanosine2251-2'-O)-methyltransferase